MFIMAKIPCSCHGQSGSVPISTMCQIDMNRLMMGGQVGTELRRSQKRIKMKAAPGVFLR